MGKGDPKTRRGKIFKGTFGKHRKSKKKTVIISKPDVLPEVKESETELAEVKITEEEVKPKVRRVAAKKPVEAKPKEKKETTKKAVDTKKKEAKPKAK